MASLIRCNMRSSRPRSVGLRMVASEVSNVADVQTDSSPDAATPSLESSTTSSSSSLPSIRTQVLLHRRPFLTPSQPELLSAAHQYNYRLSTALSSPFPEHFYLKKGSLASRRFAYESALANNKMFGEPIDEDLPIVDADEASLEVLSREAAVERDQKRGLGGKGKGLERAGERSLYCVVKYKGVGWRLPGAESDVAKDAEAAEKKEAEAKNKTVVPSAPHETAAKTLHALLGPDLSLWPVSRYPIAYLPSSSSSPSSPSSSDSPSSTFIFKSHILAGYPVLTKLAKSRSIEDFAWLTKEEIEAKVEEEASEEGREWWSRIGGLLNE